MDKASILRKMDELIQKINQWNFEYYVKDDPSVPDYVYDQAMEELKKIEEANPELVRGDSPTKHVGGGFNEIFARVKHLNPMLSLQNAFNTSDLNKFFENLGKKVTFVTEPKIDGLSISLIYQKGKLAMALTRGDGKFGENVLHNVLTIPDLPTEIPYHGTCEIRGEVYMKRHEFDDLNRHLAKKFANPRNAAAGTLRNIDSDVVKNRKLHALFYYIPQWQKMGLKTHWDVLMWLKKNGFSVADEVQHFTKFSDVLKNIAWWNEHRKKMPYQIDGVVIKVNENNLHESIGQTSKFPKWAIAYKFPAIIGETVVREITCEVGRTGKITYVGILDPILLDGSTINRVTLNNATYIQEKQLNIGDTIYIYKAGDIIPYFDQVAKRPVDERPFIPATQCPSCQTKLVRDGIEQFCPNKKCSEQYICQLIYFCSKECLDIKGLSDKTIRKFYQLGLLNKLTDLFYLKNHQEQIIGSGIKIKEKIMGKILSEIEQAKQKPLANWINGLSIRHMGKVTSQKIVQKFATIDELMDASISDLARIDDVGEVIANEIFTFFHNPESQLLIDELKNLGVLFQNNRSENQTVISPYNGKIFVITGTFDSPRDEIEKNLSERYKIKFASQVSGKTDYLLVGSNPGSKLAEAINRKIPIIREEFWKHES